MAENSRMEIEDRWVSEKEDWKSIEEYLLFLKQKKAYQFASRYCKDKNVLDYGCGSGYGSSLLSASANQVIGVDISGEVIDYCIKTHKKPNLSFQKISPDYLLPFEDEFFDVVVSFQVIEHIPEVQKYLLELKRVLKDQGILFITTPNKNHRLLHFQKPWNPDHIREYSFKQLNRELSVIYKKVELLGVYGTEEINEVEYNRVKQSPFRIYLRNPGEKLLRKILPSFVISVLRFIKRKLFTKGINATPKVSPSGFDWRKSKYNLEDFTVGDRDDICLDLLAICRKE